MSDTDVGSGIGGTGVSGQRGSPNSSSLGLVLSAGRIRSFSWWSASSRYSGQFSGTGLVFVSSVLSWLGAQRRLSLPRRRQLAFSINPFTHGA